MRARRKMSIAYVDGEGRRSVRIIWPIAMAYYVDVTVVAAWCELRDAFRHFRADRILSARRLDERFPADGGRLFAEWLALGKDRPDAPH
jgi:predicted DNA-binding transcriptional regulator YafY